MPTAGALPEALEVLAHLQPIELSSERFDTDVKRLEEALRKRRTFGLGGWINLSRSGLKRFAPPSEEKAARKSVGKRTAATKGAAKATARKRATKKAVRKGAAKIAAAKKTAPKKTAAKRSAARKAARPTSAARDAARGRRHIAVNPDLSVDEMKHFASARGIRDRARRASSSRPLGNRSARRSRGGDCRMLRLRSSRGAARQDSPPPGVPASGEPGRAGELPRDHDGRVGDTKRNEVPRLGDQAGGAGRDRALRQRARRRRACSKRRLAGRAHILPVPGDSPGGKVWAELFSSRPPERRRETSRRNQVPTGVRRRRFNADIGTARRSCGTVQIRVRLLRFKRPGRGSEARADARSHEDKVLSGHFVPRSRRPLGEEALREYRALRPLPSVLVRGGKRVRSGS